MKRWRGRWKDKIKRLSYRGGFPAADVPVEESDDDQGAEGKKQQRCTVTDVKQLDICLPEQVILYLRPIY